MKNKSECSVCLNSKAGLNCGLCNSALCKSCALFLEEGSFSFLKKIPKDLTYSTYCPHCFDKSVAGPLEEYSKTMELAKNVNIFLKNQSKESRIYKSDEPPITVEDFPDAEETLLRLAFKAVELKFNGLIAVDIYSKKVRIGGYQTLSWSGTGIPTYIHNEKSLRK